MENIAVLDDKSFNKNREDENEKTGTVVAPNDNTVYGIKTNEKNEERISTQKKNNSSNLSARDVVVSSLKLSSTGLSSRSPEDRYIPNVNHQHYHHVEDNTVEQNEGYNKHRDINNKDDSSPPSKRRSSVLDSLNKRPPKLIGPNQVKPTTTFTSTPSKVGNNIFRTSDKDNKKSNAISQEKPVQGINLKSLNLHKPKLPNFIVKNQLPPLATTEAHEDLHDELVDTTSESPEIGQKSIPSRLGKTGGIKQESQSILKTLINKPNLPVFSSTGTISHKAPPIISDLHDSDLNLSSSYSSAAEGDISVGSSKSDSSSRLKELTSTLAAGSPKNTARRSDSLPARKVHNITSLKHLEAITLSLPSATSKTISTAIASDYNYQQERAERGISRDIPSPLKSSGIVSDINSPESANHLIASEISMTTFDSVVDICDNNVDGGNDKEVLAGKSIIKQSSVRREETENSVEDLPIYDSLDEEDNQDKSKVMEEETNDIGSPPKMPCSEIEEPRKGSHLPTDLPLDQKIDSIVLESNDLPIATPGSEQLDLSETAKEIEKSANIVADTTELKLNDVEVPSSNDNQIISDVASTNQEVEKPGKIFESDAAEENADSSSEKVPEANVENDKAKSGNSSTTGDPERNITPEDSPKRRALSLFITEDDLRKMKDDYEEDGDLSTFQQQDIMSASTGDIKSTKDEPNIIPRVQIDIDRDKDKETSNDGKQSLELVKDDSPTGTVRPSSLTGAISDSSENPVSSTDTLVSRRNLNKPETSLSRSKSPARKFTGDASSRYSRGPMAGLYSRSSYGSGRGPLSSIYQKYQPSPSHEKIQAEKLKEDEDEFIDASDSNLEVSKEKLAPSSERSGSISPATVHKTTNSSVGSVSKPPPGRLTPTLLSNTGQGLSSSPSSISDRPMHSPSTRRKVPVDRTSSNVSDYFTDRPAAPASPVTSDVTDLKSPLSKPIGDREKKLLKRHLIIEELMKVEKEYVEALCVLVNEYMHHITTDGLLDDTTVKDIFYQLPELKVHHTLFNQFLVDKNKDWDNETSTIGNVIQLQFTKHSVIESYELFVENFRKSEKTLEQALNKNSSFQKFVDKRQSLHPRKLPLKAFLIQPAQRLPRYELLIKRLIENTPPDHPDYVCLHDGEKAIKSLADKVGKAKVEEEQLEALRLLQSEIFPDQEIVATGRIYIRYDQINIPELIQKSKDQFFIWIFSDLILISSSKRKGGPAGGGRKTILVKNASGQQDFVDVFKHKTWYAIGLDEVDISVVTDEQKFEIERQARRERKRKLQEDQVTLTKLEKAIEKINMPHSNLSKELTALLDSVNRRLSNWSDTSDLARQTPRLRLQSNLPEEQVDLTVEFVTIDKRIQWEDTFNQTRNVLVSNLSAKQPEFWKSFCLDDIESAKVNDEPKTDVVPTDVLKGENFFGTSIGDLSDPVYFTIPPSRDFWLLFSNKKFVSIVILNVNSEVQVRRRFKLFSTGISLNDELELESSTGDVNTKEDSGIDETDEQQVVEVKKSSAESQQQSSAGRNNELFFPQDVNCICFVPRMKKAHSRHTHTSRRHTHSGHLSKSINPHGVPGTTSCDSCSSAEEDNFTNIITKTSITTSSPKSVRFSKNNHHKNNTTMSDATINSKQTSSSPLYTSSQKQTQHSIFVTPPTPPYSSSKQPRTSLTSLVASTATTGLTSIPSSTLNNDSIQKETTQTAETISSENKATTDESSTLSTLSHEIICPHRVGVRNPTIWIGTNSGIFIFTLAVTDDEEKGTNNNYEKLEINTDSDEGENKNTHTLKFSGGEHVFSFDETEPAVKLEVAAPCLSIVYMENLRKLYAALANGDLYLYKKCNSGPFWGIIPVTVLTIGSLTLPLTHCLPVAGSLWCSFGNTMAVVNPKQMQLRVSFKVGDDKSKSVRCMSTLGQGVWIALENDTKIRLFHSNSRLYILTIDISSAVEEALQELEDEELKDMKLAELRITSMTPCKDSLWITTSSGVICSFLLPKVIHTDKKPIEPPKIATRYHGHSGFSSLVLSAEILSFGHPDSGDLNKKKTNPSSLTQITESVTSQSSSASQRFRDTFVTSEKGRGLLSPGILSQGTWTENDARRTSVAVATKSPRMVILCVGYGLNYYPTAGSTPEKKVNEDSPYSPDSSDKKHVLLWTV